VMRKTIHSQIASGTYQPAQEHSCNQCYLVFDNTSLFNLHMLSHEAGDGGTLHTSGIDASLALVLGSGMHAGSGEDGQMSLGCPVCPSAFSQQLELVEHVKTHAKQPRFRGVRGRGFGLRNFRCAECHRGFSTESRLEAHIMTHEIEESKPFECHHCGKRLMNNSALACHMKVHSTSKYYTCPICSAGFDHTAAMREHSFVHANANGTYNCPECDKVFSEFLVLKKHMKNLHTHLQFPCEQCGKVFPRADKLRLHMLRHSNIKEFMCDTCGKQVCNAI